MASRDGPIVRTASKLASLADAYGGGEMTADEFGEHLSELMTDDVVFWSSYTPSWAPLRPLFAERHGISDILDRYGYENEHEGIEDNTGVPFDIAVAGDTLYFSQRETASFFGHPPVTWEMVTKVEFRDGRICRLRMFIDSEPIEAIYGPLVDETPTRA